MAAKRAPASRDLENELIDMVRRVAPLLVSEIHQASTEMESGGRRSPRPKDTVHALQNDFVCQTDSRGYPTPNGSSEDELVLQASEGFVALWAHGVTLRWRFDESALEYHSDPAGMRSTVRRLFHEAVAAWDDACPIRFTESDDAYDFEISVRHQDRCSSAGCTLARAFFPDAGRHELVIYPKMFEQDEREQVETLIHELGHVFGLRHFFAVVYEGAFPSVIFGTHDKFTIMNYGAESRLTETDKADLKRLYEAVWSGRLTEINGTPIRLFRPYHESGELVKPRFLDSEEVSRPRNRR